MVDKRKIADRFWAKVQRGDTCWRWLASTTKGGYGQFGIHALRKSNFKATHVAIWLTTGEWPQPGKDVCHTCDHPWCVNPAHLFIGSRTDNMLDAAEKHRTQQGEKHWNARIDADTVATIRSLKSAGLRNCEIARETGVTDKTISRIVTRKRWAHVAT